MLINHIECNKLYMTLLVHKHIQRKHFSYYTYQTSVYCTICCLLIVKQWQKCQNSIHHSLRQKNKVFYIIFVKGNASRFGSAIQILPSDMENTLTHVLLLLLQLFFLFLFVYCYGKIQIFIYCNFLCQEYKFTLLYFTF